MTTDDFSSEALGKKARLFSDLLIQRQTLKQASMAKAKKAESNTSIDPRKNRNIDPKPKQR